MTQKRFSYHACYFSSKVYLFKDVIKMMSSNNTIYEFINDTYDAHNMMSYLGTKNTLLLRIRSTYL